ncbi:hypothetical protein [Fertoeibacter niger]|uniref:hypothetical protein n=1 Tax=Fertoeibacter niger TaxID=2656921 RepID=UPI001F4CE006|nr:hypothetical protein [Fertoeibacter niger]
MQGMSERQYAAHVGLSRGAIQKAKTAERLVLFADGSIDAGASDVRRAETTDPSKTRKPPEPKMKPVPEAAVAAVGDTLREQGLAVPAVGGGTTYLQAKTANEVLKAQERRIRLQKLKGELIERARALSLVFRLAREVRDTWVNWPARSSALMAAELGVEPAAMQKALEKHVRGLSICVRRDGNETETCHRSRHRRPDGGRGRSGGTRCHRGHA